MEVALLAPLLYEAVASFVLRLVRPVAGSFPRQSEHQRQDPMLLLRVAPCPHYPPLGGLVVLSGQLPACLQVAKRQHRACTHQPGHLVQQELPGAAYPPPC